jgi:hypothetical protein
VNIERERTEEEAGNIDVVDKTLAQMDYEALREVASKNLENLSK